MKIIELLKKLFFLTSLMSVILVFSYCNEEEPKEDETDTIDEIIPIEKSREELIVNRDTMLIKDPNNINEFEYKHTPEIIVGDKNDEGLTTILVKVGSNGIVHPSEPGHWIDFIALYVDGNEVERHEAENGPGSNEDSFLTNLKGAKEIKVVLGCNLHGIWINTKKIK